MTHEEKIKVVENIFDCFTEFSDNGCFVYIATPQGGIDNISVNLPKNFLNFSVPFINFNFSIQFFSC